MTVAYAAEVLLTVARTTLWSVLVFVLLPRLLFGKHVRGAGADFVRMALISIVLVHLLAALHLFDVFSLGFALTVVGLGHASLVRGRSLRRSLVDGWRRLVVVTLDFLDLWNHAAQRRRLRGQVKASIRSRLLPLKDLVARVTATPWTLLFVAVSAGIGWLHLGDAIRHPASDLPDFGVHLSWMKALAGDRLYVDGVYPYGAEALLQTLRRIITVDEALLLRVAPEMLQCLAAWLVYWAVRRLGGQRGPALLAAALFGIFAFAGWLPVVTPPSGDSIAMAVALVFLPPAAVFATEAMSGGGRPALVLAGQSMACLFLVHPFVGVVVLAGLIGAALVFLGFGLQALRRAATVALVTTAAAVLALIPLAIALATGRRLVGSILSPEQIFLGVDLRSSSDGAPLPAGDPFLVAGAVAAGILIGLVRFGPWRRQDRPSDPGRLALVAILLTTVALLLPTRFSLPALLAPNEVGRVLTPLACIVLALALDDLGQASRLLTGRWRRRWGQATGPSRRWPVGSSAGSFVVTTIMLAGLATAALPLPVQAGEREQPDAAVLQLYRINSQFNPRTWTVVSSAASLPRVRGSGFFIEHKLFLETYQPESWRYDPRRPDLAPPPPEVFIFVRTLPVVAPLPSSLDTAVVRPAPFVIEDVAMRPRLLSWVERYQASHDDLKIFHQEAGLTVFWISRSPAEEERVIRQIDEEKRKR